MIALDTSLLAYAVNRHAPGHTRAAQVVEDLVNGDTPWALPWSVVHEFLQLVTHPHAVARPLSVSDAWAFLEQVIASPSAHLLGATDRHGAALIDVLATLAFGEGFGPGVETAALLREHGVRELLTTDTEMRRFRFLDLHDPIADPEWRLGLEPARRYRVLKTRSAPTIR
jgi:toxin-antitoxin system PIN domain toxin